MREFTISKLGWCIHLLQFFLQYYKNIIMLWQDAANITTSNWVHKYYNDHDHDHKIVWWDYKLYTNRIFTNHPRMLWIKHLRFISYTCSIITLKTRPFTNYRWCMVEHFAKNHLFVQTWADVHDFCFDISKDFSLTDSLN